MPHLHSPALSETVLQTHEPPQLQKWIPVPANLTRFTWFPQAHLDGSSLLNSHLQPSSHWQRIASSPSILITCPHFSGTPHAHVPGWVLTVLHLHSAPQLQVYKTSCRSLDGVADWAVTYPTVSTDKQIPINRALISFIAISLVISLNLKLMISTNLNIVQRDFWPGPDSSKRTIANVGASREKQISTTFVTFCFCLTFALRKRRLDDTSSHSERMQFLIVNNRRIQTNGA